MTEAELKNALLESQLPHKEMLAADPPRNGANPNQA